MSLTSCTPMIHKVFMPFKKHCPNPVWPARDIGFSPTPPQTSTLSPTAELFYYFSIVFLWDKIQKEGSTYLSYAYSMVDGFSPIQLNRLLKFWSVTLNCLFYITFSMLPAFSNDYHLLVPIVPSPCYPLSSTSPWWTWGSLMMVPLSWT